LTGLTKVVLKTLWRRSSTTTSKGAGHWDAVFALRDLDTESWPEETPAYSVELLRQQAGSVIDIGAGASRLPDALQTDGRDDITVLDISREALAVTRERLGSAEGRVAYVVSDVLSWEPSRTYDLA
jgi:methylase of polypeptide subunit release factors